jgi:hypothetical protein
VYHPQANGQVEATNKLPAEIGSPSFRFQHYNSSHNDVGINLHLDLLHEKWKEARAQVATYKEKIAQYFNKTVKPQSSIHGDWVLRKVTLATKDPTKGKLGPVWEGPYRVIKCHLNGVYHLESMAGKMLSRPWNAEHLLKYYT